MSDNRKKGSLYLLIVRNYILFILAAGVLLLGIITILGYISAQIVEAPQTEKILAHTDLLEKEQYAQLPISKYLTRGSYIEILDENANVIYSSKKGIKNTYQVGDLQYIPDVDANSYFYSDIEKQKDGTTRTVITRYTYVKENTLSETQESYSTDEEDSIIEMAAREVSDAGDDEEVPVVSGIIILDQNHNIVYSDVNLGESHLSEKELTYMYGALGNEAGSINGTYLQKYSFRNNQGTRRYLMFHIANVSEETYERANQVYSSMRPIFVAGLVVLMLFSVFLMSRKVRKPLNILNHAMQEFAAGKRNGTISYTGPREFVQICDSFNEMSQRLQESENQQRKLEEEKQKMLADISHDLKTPITVIQGYSKAVCDGLVTPENMQKYLTTIYQKSNTLSELINSFYEFSKLDHPEFKPVLEKGDICEYFREYLAGKYEELELAGFHLETDLPEQQVEMEFDHMQLKRVFENIITNSVKHNRRGTTVYASLFVEKEENVIIRIGDDGVGIQDSLRESIFEPFVVGDESRNSKQGTGLGLAIAQRIVNLHGGTIRLLTPQETEKSTEFEVRLPV